MPLLKRITIFPIKSFDGHEVASATVLPSGALLGDRRYALVDSEGKFINGKRCAAIHGIRAKYTDSLKGVSLSVPGEEVCFSLQDDLNEIGEWCSNQLGTPCQLVENIDIGFPDDLNAAGPTLISTATIVEISTWFEGLTPDEMRRRLRTNLIIETDSAFWEDQLVGAPNRAKGFCIGATMWQGRGVCQRCAVPSRDSQNGKTIAGFARTFSKRRQESLPAWSPKDRFDHFYRTAINTSLESLKNGDVIRLGDQVELQEEKSLGH